MKQDPKHKQYGIRPGQIWTSADGAGIRVEVIDVTTHESVDDVIVQWIKRDGTRPEPPYRIDAWKLAKVRYTLEKDV